MARCRLRPQAEADLEAIGDHIARDNPIRAMSFVDEVMATCRRLAASPLIGRARSDLQDGLRSFPHAGYLIFYRSLPDGVEIVRILHGAATFPACSEPLRKLAQSDGVLQDQAVVNVADLQGDLGVGGYCQLAAATRR